MKISSISLFLAGLSSLAAPLHAGVSFVRNIPLPTHSPVIPLRTDSADTPYVYLICANQIWRMGPGETSFELVDDGISGVKITRFSTVMLDNADPSAQNLAFFGLNQLAYEYSLNDLSFTNSHGQYPAIQGDVRAFAPYGAGHGILLDGSGTVGLPGGKRVWDINLEDGTLKLLFGGLNDAWNFQAADDGGIWLMNNTKTQLDKFTQTFGEWSATTSFFISGTFDGTMALATTGELILGDGLGGGSLYSPTGTLLETFSPPPTAVFDPLSTGSGTPYINIDSTGMITVYANTRPGVFNGQGMYNIYQIPEPSTCVLLGLGLATMSLRVRRRRRGGDALYVQQKI